MRPRVFDDKTAIHDALYSWSIPSRRTPALYLPDENENIEKRTVTFYRIEIYDSLLGAIFSRCRGKRSSFMLHTSEY